MKYLIKEVQFTGCEAIWDCLFPRLKILIHPSTQVRDGLHSKNASRNKVCDKQSEPMACPVSGFTNPNRPENPFVYERRLGGKSLDPL